MPFQHLDDRRTLDALLLDDAGEGWGLENAEPNVESDPDHDDAEPERHAPSPVEKLVARDPAEQQHDYIGEEQPGRTAPLRPRGNKPAMGISPGPFHRD